MARPKTQYRFSLPDGQVFAGRDPATIIGQYPDARITHRWSRDEVGNVEEELLDPPLTAESFTAPVPEEAGTAVTVVTVALATEPQGAPADEKPAESEPVAPPPAFEKLRSIPLRADATTPVDTVTATAPAAEATP